MSSPAEALSRKIAESVAGAVTRADVPAQPSAVTPIANAVTRAVVPEILSATNNEPWYRSRVTWGAIASIVLPLLGALGVTSDVIDSDQFVALGLALGTAAGGLLTLYGRWKAKRPIGQ